MRPGGPRSIATAQPLLAVPPLPSSCALRPTALDSVWCGKEACPPGWDRHHNPWNFSLDKLCIPFVPTLSCRSRDDQLHPPGAGGPADSFRGMAKPNICRLKSYVPWQMETWDVSSDLGGEVVGMEIPSRDSRKLIETRSQCSGYQQLWRLHRHGSQR